MASTKRKRKSSYKLAWSFPLKKFFFLRIEKVFLVILTLLIFLFSYIQLGQRIYAAILFTFFFLVLYIFLSYLIQKSRAVEEHYEVRAGHLHIIRKTKRRVKKDKVPLKRVVFHKLDKIFLGGYIITVEGKKHILFFNNREELKRFENFIKNHMKIVKKTKKEVKKK